MTQIKITLINRRQLITTARLSITFCRHDLLIARKRYIELKRSGGYHPNIEFNLKPLTSCLCTAALVPRYDNWNKLGIKELSVSILTSRIYGQSFIALSHAIYLAPGFSAVFLPGARPGSSRVWITDKGGEKRFRPGVNHNWNVNWFRSALHGCGLFATKCGLALHADGSTAQPYPRVVVEVISLTLRWILLQICNIHFLLNFFVLN